MALQVLMMSMYFDLRSGLISSSSPAVSLHM